MHSMCVCFYRVDKTEPTPPPQEDSTEQEEAAKAARILLELKETEFPTLQESVQLTKVSKNTCF